ncbi:hypothetical protein [Elizabethkingia anophelis]|uniref:hypothetical protein n=1 Tax=Elizabethkingia anophelis TaxID=1117645 RepID=UPI0038916BD1
MDSKKQLNKKINFLLDVHDSYGIYKDKNGVVKNITKENLYSEIENLKSNKASRHMLECTERVVSRLNDRIQDLEFDNSNRINYLGMFSIIISILALIISFISSVKH